ncbi:MAG: DUF4907 domain-containing protein [Chitinophagales bacterium]|nr:DUF4907 domain-containing protein [Chitinophagales bacterium]
MMRYLLHYRRLDYLLIASFLFYLTSCGQKTFNKEKESFNIDMNQHIEDQPSLHDSSLFNIKISYNNQTLWGYQIYKGEKLLINQTSIPGIQGNLGFQTKEQALKTALLVRDKLLQGQMPPTVIESELDSLGVLPAK